MEVTELEYVTPRVPKEHLLIYFPNNINNFHLNPYCILEAGSLFIWTKYLGFFWS